ncbi:hypothetical protein [Billgrantia ethanolica]|uniref:Uncharacterized protein n=1 Tax=Billgrantia ethanolica TaxID=2733486 RepID=A0ABS9A8J9_9GAMM|nr:hypothetical protein [Halomonas ethanolica]MCE8005147.1 hypothetical protein [Halomonas ethanolica]
MDIEKIEKGIEKTGFRLEFDISNILVKNGWNVINNKYYVDDQQEVVREIDIVAYKANLVHDIYVYTALILSCKKSEQNAWALLSKESNHSDPNIEWVPVHAWSNDRVLSYMLDEPDWKEFYLSILKQKKANIVTGKPERHIFGFQEMNKVSGSPQNDKNIFNSVNSVMKAQAYEMNALPLRKKDSCVFQFNLLSVAQTDLVRLDFEKNIAKGFAIDDEIYVAGYILDKQQTFAKVHFVRADRFEKIIQQYNNLHNANKMAFGKIHEKFCSEITRDAKKLNFFKDDVADDIWWSLYSLIEEPSKVNKLLKEGHMHWNKQESTIEFQVDLHESEVATMNEGKEAREELSEALRKYYKYEGKSKFEVFEIPF